jgi:hypothetical protein
MRDAYVGGRERDPSLEWATSRVGQRALAPRRSELPPSLTATIVNSTTVVPGVASLPAPPVGATRTYTLH